ncbi:sugar phosphate isomerase/epimerase family protein [Bifidobacterium choloepi]|uniref:Sugar phosphate isomerase/epimerase n=1 Tax=Bifidobacterium choloepi TaxID=2614131 RepID=A0A6I5NKX6_9BIFI|nr:sugar phosphate isomerase/epimerase [Bifidobacterium choloepi]NEG69492.1 sugar phosphate isomerase/epimerase [Bifidobacterium choloepi]
MNLVFGARAHDVDFDRTPESLAAALADQDVETVQFAPCKLFPSLPAEGANLSPGYGQHMRRTLAERGIDIAVLSCYANLIHPDPASRDAILSKFESYLSIARFFGAPIVASETGSMHEPADGYTTDNFTEDAYRRVVESVRRLAGAGERYRTYVGIEPGRNHPIHDLDTVERLLEDVDSEWVCIVFDPAVLIDGSNWQDEPELVEQAFDRFGERICAMHLKDFRPQDGTEELEMVDLGDGVMNVEAVLRTAERHRPFLPVLTERTHGERIGQAIRRYRSL